LFPSYFSMRTLIVAAMFTALLSMPGHKLMAAEPLFKSVPTDRIGDAQALDDSARPAADTVLHLTFSLNSASSQNIAAFVATLTDPTSPNYHKWLTPAEFGDKFGASVDDITTITKYLAGNQFSNVKVWSNKLFVTADITRANAESVFGVTVHGYDRTSDEIARGYDATYFAPDHAPLIAANVANVIHAMYGLSNAAEKLPTYSRSHAKPEIATDGSLDPQDLASAYNITALHTANLEGQGTTIAIYSPTTFVMSDVNAFFKGENLTKPSINVVPTSEGLTDVTDGDAAEACFDIENIGAQAPEATINVYEAPNDDGFEIWNQIAEDDTATIVSESYGTDEVTVDQTYADDYDTIRAELSAEGITIFVASGDNGAYAVGSTTQKSVSVDASSQYVTAVGGTDLTLSDDAWAGEVAWSWSTGDPEGSNGGLSIYYTLPSWQVGTGVKETGVSDGYRQVPDVAALAGDPGYDIYTGGSFQPYVGTSGACPLWAAAFDLIEDQIGIKQGNINPKLYSVAASNPSVYHDITSGTNGVYSCGTGWDFVTGWGSADFDALLNALTSSSTSITLTVSNYPLNPGLQMLTIPYLYTGTTASISSIFTGLVTPEGVSTDVIAAWDAPNQEYAVTPTPPANLPVPGTGFWARLSNAGGAVVQEGGLVLPLTYAVTLSQGWNIIGDPYLTAVPISSLVINNGTGNQTFATAVANDIVYPDLWTYSSANSANYQESTIGSSLAPWTGYWIYAYQPTKLIFYQQ